MCLTQTEIIGKTSSPIAGHSPWCSAAGSHSSGKQWHLLVSQSCRPWVSGPFASGQGQCYLLRGKTLNLCRLTALTPHPQAFVLWSRLTTLSCYLSISTSLLSLATLKLFGGFFGQLPEPSPQHSDCCHGNSGSLPLPELCSEDRAPG